MLLRIKILKDTYMMKESITYEHSYEDKENKNIKKNINEANVIIVIYKKPQCYFKHCREELFDA